MEVTKYVLRDKLNTGGGTSIDVILSGHAHGGQWRFFGQGIFAPGQGWLPKLTSGVHDGRLVISRGLANTANVPRFFNETELVVTDVEQGIVHFLFIFHKKFKNSASKHRRIVL